MNLLWMSPWDNLELCVCVDMLVDVDRMVVEARALLAGTRFLYVDKSG